jgi:hypothetical protein
VRRDREAWFDTKFEFGENYTLLICPWFGLLREIQIERIEGCRLVSNSELEFDNSVMRAKVLLVAFERVKHGSKAIGPIR